MQGSSALLDVEMHHHGGVVAVWPTGHLGVPRRLDQTHERIAGGRQRWPLIAGGLAIAVIVFPLRD